MARRQQRRECRLYNKKISGFCTPFTLILNTRILSEPPIFDREKVIYPLLLLVLDSEPEVRQCARDWKLLGDVLPDMSVEEISSLPHRVLQWKLEVQSLSCDGASQSAETMDRLAAFPDEISQRDPYGILTLGIRLLWLDRCQILMEDLSASGKTDGKEQFLLRLRNSDQRNRVNTEQILQQCGRGRGALYLPMVWFFLHDRNLREEWSEKLRIASEME